MNTKTIKLILIILAITVLGQDAFCLRQRSFIERSHVFPFGRYETLPGSNIVVINDRSQDIIRNKPRFAMVDWDDTVSAIIAEWRRIAVEEVAKLWGKKNIRSVDYYVALSTGTTSVMMFAYAIMIAKQKDQGGNISKGQIKMYMQDKSQTTEADFENDVTNGAEILVRARRLSGAFRRLIDEQIRDKAVAELKEASLGSPSDYEACRTRYTVNGAPGLIEMLQSECEGVVLASGSPVASVKEGIRLLGFEDYFSTNIFCAGMQIPSGDGTVSFSKEAVASHMVVTNDLQRGELLVIGDGIPEIAVGNKFGAITIGIVPDYITDPDLAKALCELLIKAGVDYLVRDFKEAAYLKDYLFGPKRGLTDAVSVNRRILESI